LRPTWQLEQRHGRRPAASAGPHQPPAGTSSHRAAKLLRLSLPAPMRTFENPVSENSDLSAVRDQRIFVRIGDEGWDRTVEGKGTYEDKDKLWGIFEQYGRVDSVHVCHRVQEDREDGDLRNTSWALVTMGSVATAAKALQADWSQKPLHCSEFELMHASRGHGHMANIMNLQHKTYVHLCGLSKVKFAEVVRIVTMTTLDFGTDIAVTLRWYSSDDMQWVWAAVAIQLLSGIASGVLMIYVFSHNPYMMEKSIEVQILLGLVIGLLGMGPVATAFLALQAGARHNLHELRDELRWLKTFAAFELIFEILPQVRAAPPRRKGDCCSLSAHRDGRQHSLDGHPLQFVCLLLLLGKRL
jgi:hypothetical protein